MKVVSVTRAQQMGAQLLVEILEEDGKPVPDWARRVAAATRRPDEVEPELEATDPVVFYLA